MQVSISPTFAAGWPAIKTVAESVTDIGAVYDQMPHVKMWDEVFRDLISDDKLKVFFFTKLSRTSTKRSGYLDA